MKRFKITFIFSLTLLMSFCGGGKDRNGQEPSTASSGTVHISVDETFAPIIKQQIEAYMNAYPGTHIIAHYKPESECLEELMKDSSKLVIIPRRLTEEEKDYFLKSRQVSPQQTVLSVDGIALITANSNKQEQVKLADVLKIMKGEIKTWKDLDANNNKDSIMLVFDNASSSTVRYFAGLAGAEKLGNRVYAVKNNPSVISYVQEHPSAIGFIGVNWISDTDDSTSQAFLEKIKVLSVVQDDTSRFAGKSSQPYQYYLATGEYALRREVYAINCEGRMGLGTGFVNYLCSDKGQAIFRLSGLVPLRHLIKAIEVKTE